MMTRVALRRTIKNVIYSLIQTVLKNTISIVRGTAATHVLKFRVRLARTVIIDILFLYR